jgi:photosystem II stability/assembly factor-like uncharacterized protein
LLAIILMPPPASGQSPIEEGDDPPGFRLFLPILRTNSAAPVPQLLLNPSFEAQPDGAAYWQWLASEITYQILNDPQGAHHGQQYLTVNRQNQAFGNKSLYQDMNQPQAGKTYHFAVWVRASEAALSAGKPRAGRVALWAHGGAPQREHSVWNFQLTDPAWHCVETSLKVKQSGHVYLRTEIYLTSLDNLDTYIDQAILRDDGQATCPPPPVNDGATLISQEQGFDTCAAPEVAHLAAWKQASPYNYLGIYLGGANHYAPCKSYNQQYQTAAWFAQVRQQGWRFIPIWVGPQAPCASFTTVMSSDINTARSQGINEAQQALGAAANLGLISPAKPYTIIYYDIEAYNVNNSACHNAVNAFLEGWVSELQNQGHKAGIYGSVMAVNSWYTLWHVPDSVWVARYIGSGYDPNMSVSLLNQGWITESYWDNHRLFQYSGGHVEEWGGVALNIDNDTAAGLVALSTPGQPLLQKMAFVSPGQGWIWLNQRLFWTNTSGDTWLDITPPGVTGIEDIFFLDASRGWLVSRTDDPARFQLSRTTDGGQSWQTLPLAVLSAEPLPVSAAYLDFVNAQTGWLVFELAAGPNFSRGLLFGTTDGGDTWSQLTMPLGEPAHFISEMFGWTAGGPTGSELYVTRDGGQSWQAQAIVPPTQPVQQLVYQLPAFESEQAGRIAVTVSDDQESRIELYATQDGGRSWRMTDSLTLKQRLALGTSLPLHIDDTGRWLVADPDYTPSFPDHIVALDLITDQIGWAHTRDHTCAGPCRRQDSLWRTTDGGQSWLQLKLP